MDGSTAKESQGKEEEQVKTGEGETVHTSPGKGEKSHEPKSAKGERKREEEKTKGKATKKRVSSN